MNEEIGLRIQQVRKKKGLSRGDLADMSGISPKLKSRGLVFRLIR